MSDTNSRATPSTIDHASGAGRRDFLRNAGLAVGGTLLAATAPATAAAGAANGVSSPPITLSGAARADRSGEARQDRHQHLSAALALEYEDGEWDGFEGAQHLMKEVLKAL